MTEEEESGYLHDWEEDHLIKGCKYWVKRRELREGWCPEVA